MEIIAMKIFGDRIRWHVYNGQEMYTTPIVTVSRTHKAQWPNNEISYVQYIDVFVVCHKRYQTESPPPAERISISRERLYISRVSPLLYN